MRDVEEKTVSTEMPGSGRVSNMTDQQRSEPANRNPMGSTEERGAHPACAERCHSGHVDEPPVWKKLDSQGINASLTCPA